jgi:hypothetical protein
LFWKGE